MFYFILFYIILNILILPNLKKSLVMPTSIILNTNKIPLNILKYLSVYGAHSYSPWVEISSWGRQLNEFAVVEPPVQQRGQRSKIKTKLKTDSGQKTEIIETE